MLTFLCFLFHSYIYMFLDMYAIIIVIVLFIYLFIFRLKKNVSRLWKLKLSLNVIINYILEKELIIFHLHLSYSSWPSWSCIIALQKRAWNLYSLSLFLLSTGFGTRENCEVALARFLRFRDSAARRRAWVYTTWHTSAHRRQPKAVPQAIRSARARAR